MTEYGFTGTQTGLTTAQTDRLREILAALTAEDMFRHGDCVGADEQAHGIVREVSLARVHVHPPTNPRLRAFCQGDVIWLPRPYLDRNRDIVDRSTSLIACPKGPEEQRSGTWSTVRYARGKGRSVMIVWPDGSVSG